MQALIEVPDEKVSFVMELLKNLPFVEIKEDVFRPSSEQPPVRVQHSLSPKTASLLGVFSTLVNEL